MFYNLLSFPQRGSWRAGVLATTVWTWSLYNAYSSSFDAEAGAVSVLGFAISVFNFYLGTDSRLGAKFQNSNSETTNSNCCLDYTFGTLFTANVAMNIASHYLRAQ